MGSATMSEENKTQIDIKLPCPFCGCTELTDNQWYFEESGEVPAVECSKCFAGAPLKAWNKRNATE